MPHPERACEGALGSADGLVLLESVVAHVEEERRSRPERSGMAIRPDQSRIIGRALVASGGLMFLLGAAFWNGALQVEEAVRPPLTIALAVVGVSSTSASVSFFCAAPKGRTAVPDEKFRRRRDGASGRARSR